MKSINSNGLKDWTEFGNNAYANLREGKLSFPRYKWTHEKICHWTPRKILEIGIGSGQSLKKLADLGHECCGIDLENNINKVTSSKYMNPNIKYVVQNADQPNIEWSNRFEKFHVGIIHYVLQHLVFDSNALYAIRNMLEPEGTLFVTVPIAGDTRHSAHIYSETTFERLVEAIGFKVEAKKKLNREEFIVMATKV